MPELATNVRRMTIDEAIERGLATADELKDCSDCGVPPGTAHNEGCDIERCTGCGMQRLGCNIDHHDPEQAKWTGIWPGELECREKGWTTGPFAGYPFGMPDLNRLIMFELTGKDPGSSGSIPSLQ